jgi:hypothetical protein
MIFSIVEYLSDQNNLFHIYFSCFILIFSLSVFGLAIPGSQYIKISSNSLVYKQSWIKYTVRWERITSISDGFQQRGFKKLFGIYVNAPNIGTFSGSLFIPDWFTIGRSELSEILRERWAQAKARQST